MSRPFSPATETKETIVIGAGISGLVVAATLAQRGHAVTVLEASHRVGGLIQSRQQHGYLTEAAASMVLNFRPEVARFLSAHGLSSHIEHRHERASRRRFLIHNGQLHPLPAHLWGLLTTPIWSGRGKLRLLAEPFIPKGGHRGESVSEFICRRLGREVLERAIEPFVSGILASDPDSANAWSTLPRLTALERRYGSIGAGVLTRLLQRQKGDITSEAFSFQGGMERVTTTLAQTPGVTLKHSYRVQAVTPTTTGGSSGWRLECSDPHGDRQLYCEQLVVATDAHSAARLLQGVDNRSAHALSQLRYAPVAVVHTAFEAAAIAHPLDGSGFLVPRTEQRLINGNLWMSSLFHHRAPEGTVLLSSYVGGARAPQQLQLEDEALIHGCSADIHHYLHPTRRGATPIWGGVDRHPQALPLYLADHPALLTQLLQLEQQQPSLHLVGNYRGGISVRDRIVAGLECANRIYPQPRLQPSWALQPQ